MLNTPKSLRLQIGIFGRTNVGKSSLLNMIANQDVAVTSEEPGTTTDVVEKSMELLPIGPVTILDTGGIDDVSTLGTKRIERTEKIFDRADIIILVIEPNQWTEFEQDIADRTKKSNIPLIIAVNKIDIQNPDTDFIDRMKKISKQVVTCSSIDLINRDQYIKSVKHEIITILPPEFMKQQPLIRDLVPKNGIVVLLVPIDSEAPKGRIILPQVQTIRDLLDGHSISVVVQHDEYPYVLETLSRKPDLVVCDSQVVDHMVKNTPDDILCTTFSILFSRFKGDLIEESKGVAAIENVKKGEKILIAEACSHHPNEDDIGRVKIPRWLKQFKGEEVSLDIVAGRDYPANLEEYKAIIHCGGCMLTRNEKLVRIEKARDRGVPITNYGILISLMHGVVERTLQPFPEALEAYREIVGN